MEGGGREREEVVRACWRELEFTVAKEVNWSVGGWLEWGEGGREGDWLIGTRAIGEDALMLLRRQVYSSW